MSTQTCPNCGEENPDRARLCMMCGTALARAPREQTEERPEGDEAVSCAHVQQDIPGRELGVVQHSVTDGPQELKLGLLLLWVPA